MGIIGIRSHAAGALADAGGPSHSSGDTAGAGHGQRRQAGVSVRGPIRTLSQAAMVFCLMNRDIHTVVPGVKNTTEAEETAASVDVPPIPEHHLERLRELYRRGFAGA